MRILAPILCVALSAAFVGMNPVAPMTAAAAPRGWIVSPTGRPEGDGSLARPWDLQTALRRKTTVKPGDTVWLRGGTYGTGGSTLFISQLVGTQLQPITVRAYWNERATINGGITEFDEAAQNANPCCGPYVAQFVHYRDLEITNTSRNRVGADPTRTNTADRSSGLALYGQGSKSINNVVSNTGHPAIGMWSSATMPGQGTGQEVYGNIIYGTGLYDRDGRVKSGSGIYAQNRIGTKRIADTISFRNFTTGMKTFGNATNGMIFEGNTVFDNKTNLFTTANGEETTGLKVLYNMSWARRDKTTFVGFGTYSPPGAPWNPGKDAEIRGNYFVGAFFHPFPDAAGNYPMPVMHVENWRDQLTVVDNTTVGSFIQFHRLSGSQTDWGHNRYFYPPNARFYVYQDGTYTNRAGNGSFEGWKAGCRCDADSTVTAGYPTTNAVFVRPNAYESGRAHVTIYNWEGQQAVAVDLSSVLKLGEAYEVRDVQKYFGQPVATGSYTGQPIAIPMNLIDVAPVIAATHVPNVHTAPAFGVFVVRKLATLSSGIGWDATTREVYQLIKTRWGLP